MCSKFGVELRGRKSYSNIELSLLSVLGGGVKKRSEGWQKVTNKYPKRGQDDYGGLGANDENQPVFINSDGI